MAPSHVRFGRLCNAEWKAHISDGHKSCEKTLPPQRIGIPILDSSITTRPLGLLRSKVSKMHAPYRVIDAGKQENFTPWVPGGSHHGVSDEDFAAPHAPN